MSNGFPGIKHPKGRAVGEMLKGAAAMVTHKHRHTTPALLAQTSAMGKSMGIGPKLSDLQQEPPPAIVNASPTGPEPAREILVEGTVRVSLCTSVMFVTDSETSELFGRFGKLTATINSDAGEVVLTIDRSEIGYQWGPYHTKTIDPPQKRLSMVRKHQEIQADIQDFGLTEFRFEVYPEQIYFYALVTDLKKPRDYSAGKKSPRGNRTPPAEPIKPRAGSVTPDVMADLPITTMPGEVTANQVIEDIRAIVELNAHAAPIGGVISDSRVRVWDLRSAIATINDAVLDPDTKLKLYIDTTSGLLRGRMEVDL